MPRTVINRTFSGIPRNILNQDSAYDHCNQELIVSTYINPIYKKSPIYYGDGAFPSNSQQTATYFFANNPIESTNSRIPQSPRRNHYHRPDQEASPSTPTINIELKKSKSMQSMCYPINYSRSQTVAPMSWEIIELQLAAENK